MRKETLKLLVASLVFSLLEVQRSTHAIEVETQATARSLVPKADAQSTFLILDISTVRSSMIIFDNEALHFTSSLPIAGNSFTEKILSKETLFAF